MKLIPHNGRAFGEVRKAHFLKAFDLPVELMQIVSFGSCNFHCPYCKRDGQYIDSSGNIYTAKEYDFDVVLGDLLKTENRIRLSGGDPCMHVKDSLAIAKAVMDVKGQKISIAHESKDYQEGTVLDLSENALFHQRVSVSGAFKYFYVLKSDTAPGDIIAKRAEKLVKQK